MSSHKLPSVIPGGRSRAAGVLFSGDVIYDRPLLDELPRSNIGEYLATMRRLRELPVEVVHGGRDPSLGRRRFVELADRHIIAHS